MFAHERSILASGLLLVTLMPYLMIMTLSRCVLNDCFLVHYGDLFPFQEVSTYVNISLNHQSQIDYALVFSVNGVS